MHDVYMPTQGAAGIRAELAYVTGIPQEQLRVHAQDVGGAFGVRNEIYPGRVISWAQKKTPGSGRGLPFWRGNCRPGQGQARRSV
jgi:CO/xanthine dehydrogenase Mo-binding subunit